VQCNNIGLFFLLLDLSPFLAATLAYIKKAVFWELRLKFSKIKLNFKDHFRQATNGAHLSLHNEDITEAVIASNIVF
jgi:hypothetical protein